MLQRPIPARGLKQQPQGGLQYQEPQRVAKTYPCKGIETRLQIPSFLLQQVASTVPRKEIETISDPSNILSIIVLQVVFSEDRNIRVRSVQN